MTQQNTVVPSIAAGDRLANVWQVERVLGAQRGVTAALARSAAGGRALCFLTSDEDHEPALDETSETIWATSRKVMRDELHGRVVVDVIGAGELLSDLLAADGIVPPSVTEALAGRARAEHRRGRAHGQLKADRIVLGPEGPQVAGWGLVAGVTGDLIAGDLADLAALSGESGTGPDLPGAREPRAASLHAAIISEHLPTLRRAVATVESSLVGEPDEDLLRARDALKRVESKVDECLVSARRSIGRDDPLGAVAACREAIRHGAEQEAEPMLRMARRRAKEMLDGPRRPGARWLVAGAIAIAVLAVAALVAWTRAEGGAQRELVARVEQLSAEQGQRAAVRLLVASHSRGELHGEGLDLLAEHLSLLATSERKRLLVLRREAIAQGARPRTADREAEEALSDLEQLARRPEHPAFATQLQRALSRIERAASVYRSRAELTAEQAMRAVELLILEDPVFAKFGQAPEGAP